MKRRSLMVTTPFCRLTVSRKNEFLPGRGLAATAVDGTARDEEGTA
jgi:hypothetical protein